MGHFMGIRPFFNKIQYDEVQRELTRAQAKDRRAERQSDEAGNHLRARLAGEGSHDLTKTEYHPCVQNHIPFVRDTFAKHVIRRTLDSIDYRGHKIFGMRPYREHIMLLELRQWEKQALSTLTDQMIESKPETTLISSANVSFYSPVLLAPAFTSQLLPMRSGASSDWFRPFFRCVPTLPSGNFKLTTSIPSEFLYRISSWTPTSAYEPSFPHP